jgi:KUP system potassium uptake protein
MTNDNKSTNSLAIAALGIVFGDIGTSPLYAFKECLVGTIPSSANIMGILSLIVWVLFCIVTIKYLLFVMRADNDGEGGIFALLSLIFQQEEKLSMRVRPVLTLIALFGAALLYGDGIITPAISVLSAVEGLSIATKAAEPLVLPLTCLILFALFAIQKKGTEQIGRLFGPVMLIWFLALAVLGLGHIIKNPDILSALSPYYAIEFMFRNRLLSLIVLSSVFLAVTGGEALYADMGHFGRKPIQRAWLIIVFPAIIINYFGQGAYLLR